MKIWETFRVSGVWGVIPDDDDREESFQGVDQDLRMKSDGANFVGSNAQRGAAGLTSTLHVWFIRLVFQNLCELTGGSCTTSPQDPSKPIDLQIWYF